jgi:glycosyltransferase involved in cell wall biosynthesis
MRILQIHPFLKSESLSPSASGMARKALQLTRLLADIGHDVQVLPIPEGVGSRVVWEVAPGIPVDVVPAMITPERNDVRWLAGSLRQLRPRSRDLHEIFFDACALAALRRAIFSFRPDIVHNHFARRPFPRLARALGLRENLVLTHHHGEAGEELDVYDRIAFPSESARDGIVRESGYPRKKTTCVYCPVDPIYLSGKVAPDRGRLGVCFIGAVRQRKGVDLLVEAWRGDARLRHEPLYICGVGPDMDLVTEAKNRDHLPIHQEGYCSPEALTHFLQKVRLVVIPSRMETLGVSLLEAMCSGVPVVGWAPTVLEMEKVLGMPVGIPFDGRTQSAKELADAIDAARNADFCRTANRREMARIARTVFSPERFCDNYLQIYQELA